MKFYSAWGLAQTAVDLSGLSWNKHDHEFNGVKTGSFNFELESNPKFKTEFWNSSIQNWLKDCFYNPFF